jgi:hypothetical protein
VTTVSGNPQDGVVVDYPPGGLPPALDMIGDPEWGFPLGADLDLVYPNVRGPQVRVMAVDAVNASQIPGPVMRRTLIEALADVDGLLWRGRAVDTAGRVGVAVSAEQDGERHTLLLSQATGEVLAYTRTATGGVGRLVSYTLYTRREFRPTTDMS